MDKDVKETWTGAYAILWKALVLLDCLMYGSYSVLVHLSKDKGHLPYNSASVVLVIEIVKLCISSCLFLQEQFRNKFAMPQLSYLIIAQYAVPGILYCINNNIAIHMQLHMDPTTYQVLSNMKIGTTAIFYACIINKTLSGTKWAAIGLLLFAGFLDSFAGFQNKTQTGTQQIFITTLGLFMISTYVTISGLSAVYTEYILKKYSTISLNLQNILLYTYGITLNVGVSYFGVGYSSPDSGKPQSFTDGFSIYVLVIIITQALNGLIMSIVMKCGSNITRLFIISGAMLTTTILSVLLLGTELNMFFFAAALTVVAAIYLYHR